MNILQRLIQYGALVMAMLLSGCGSISTIGKPDAIVASDLRRHHSNCNSIPRLYSGVSYDFCRIDSRYQSMGTDVFGSFILLFFVIDTLPSAVVDTLATPYTGYQQIQHKNITIK